MRNFKKIYFLFLRQMMAAVSRKRILAGYLIGMAVTLRISYNYSQFAGSHTVNIAEAFIQNYASFGNVTLMLFGFIMALSDAPFVYTDSFMMIHRAGRKQWYRGMWLYIIGQGILYYGGSLLVSIAFIIQKAYIDDVWGKPLINYQSAALETYQIQAPTEELLNGFSPYLAMAHTFLLIFMYSVFLGGVLFALNMYRSAAVGTAVVAVIHLAGMVMGSAYFMIGNLMAWDFVHNAIFAEHFNYGLSLLHSYLLFTISIYIVYNLGSIIVMNTDFGIVEGSEQNG